ncbi:MAG TPA: CPXCG motif-containing cysteine-rich protein [Steroidobacteraceae bacterium]|nr:CPXCG motif-containing cysteine-rich protein [Steroidobacteraceae bacterium]
MKRPRSHKVPTLGDSNASTQRDVDALYGLEPVFEPGREPGRELGPASTFHRIECPYCGERFDTQVETGAGTATYIEDCQICCQPIEFDLQVDSDGAFVRLEVRRC